MAASANQDTTFASIFDTVRVSALFTQYGTTFELLLDDPARQSVTLGQSGLAYADYATVQAAWRTTTANPEGAVRLLSSFGYTFIVPLPVFLDHPMWGGTPPGPPNTSGNEQDYAWNIAAQAALAAWLASQG